MLFCGGRSPQSKSSQGTKQPASVCLSSLTTLSRALLLAKKEKIDILIRTEALKLGNLLGSHLRKIGFKLVRSQREGTFS